MLMVEGTTHAWINNKDILHPLREIPGKVNAQIFLLVINAHNLNHCLGYLRPRLINVRWLDTEKGNIGTLVRPIGKP